MFILLSAAVDFFDGFVARLLKIASEMGKQLDSIADVVSFGVAPSLIVFRYIEYIFVNDNLPTNKAFFYALPAFVIACAGAYRLARFNISTIKSVNFQGVPIPAAGLLTASFPFIFTDNHTPFILQIFASEWFWYTYILFISCLMISALPMMSLKFKVLSLKNDWWKILLVIAALVSALLLHWLAVPVIFVLYVLLSIIMLRNNESVM